MAIIVEVKTTATKEVEIISLGSQGPVGPAGVPGADGSPGPAGSEALLSRKNVSGNTLYKGALVSLATSSEVVKAQANSLNGSEVLGMVRDSTIPDATFGNILASGLLTMATGDWDSVADEVGGLLEGEYYYLSNTLAGQMSRTPPASGYLVQLGYAISPTEFLLNVRSPVIL